MPDTGLILYEFPCSEKIRFYLRLEALKQRLDWFLALDGKAAHQAAINALFDLSDVAARSDLKNELLKALLQQRRDIEALPANATVDGQPAKTVLALVSEAANSVSAAVGRTSQILRDNEWLQLIRNRQRLPGGTCEFDLPQLHYWLSQPAEIRRQELQSLAQTLLPITNAAQLILDHLRAQTIISDAVAEHGTMQIPTSGSPYQLARIWMPQDSQCIPDMSANRHTLWLRFSTPDAKHRLHAVHETLSFRLGLCI